jgi:hypothetical protein
MENKDEATLIVEVIDNWIKVDEKNRESLCILAYKEDGKRFMSHHIDGTQRLLSTSIVEMMLSDKYFAHTMCNAVETYRRWNKLPAKDKQSLYTSKP